MDRARDDIDNFYETYNKKKERNIAENKYGLPFPFSAPN